MKSITVNSDPLVRLEYLKVAGKGERFIDSFDKESKEVGLDLVTWCWFKGLGRP